MNRDQSEYLKAYRQRPEYQAQLDRYRAAAKRKMGNDPIAREKRSQYGKAYYLKNREAVLKRTRQRQIENAESEKARSRKYYMEHKEDYRARAQRYRAARLEKCPLLPRISPEEAKRRKLERTRKWILEHPEKCKEMRRSWEARNKDKRKAYNTQHAHNRRARQKLSRKDNAAVYSWIRSWKKKATVRCYWCSVRFKPSQCHVDHIVPISSGGKNTIGNVCISCAKCNIRKRTKELKVWNQQIEQPVLF
jgi:5-methylcytosine-specific restriction endonuclease McrA